MRKRIGTDVYGTPLYQSDDGHIWFGCHYVHPEKVSHEEIDWALLQFDLLPNGIGSWTKERAGALLSRAIRELVAEGKMPHNMQMGIEKIISDGTDGHPCGVAWYRLCSDGVVIGGHPSIQSASTAMEKLLAVFHEQEMLTMAKQRQSNAFEAAWKEELAKVSSLKADNSLLAKYQREIEEWKNRACTIPKTCVHCNEGFRTWNNEHTYCSSCL